MDKPDKDGNAGGPHRPATHRESADPHLLLIQFSSIANPRDRAEFISNTMARLAVEAPAAALLFAEGLPPGPWRTPALIQGLELLATSGEGLRALHEAARLLPAGFLAEAQLSIAAGWAKHSPQDAIKWVGTLTDETLRASAMQMVASEWGAADPSAALTWLGTQPQTTAWDQVITNVAAAWAASQPESALKWARQQAAANPDAPNPMTVVYQEWGSSNPAAAASALLHEDPTLQQATVAAMAKTWAETDPPAAAAWINHLQDQTARQAALNALSNPVTGSPDLSQSPSVSP